MQINRESVLESLNNRVAVKFSNVFENEYSWTHFIEFINYAIKEKNPYASKTEVKETIGYVNFWHRLTMTLDNTSEDYFPNLEQKHELLQSFIDKGYLGRFGALSFTDSEPTTGRHSDPVTVMYWNCIGSVRWDVYPDSGQQTFILNPGDVILVPHDTMHEVTSLGPRAAISFMFEK